MIDVQTIIKEAYEMTEKTKQRRGQALFNTLYYYHPDIANQIRATKLDPFHNDDIIPEFIDYLYKQ